MRRISVNYTPGLRNENFMGYGNSFQYILSEMKKYAFNEERLQVDIRNARAPVSFYYGTDPVENAFYSGQYRIHMSQHESTMIENHKVHAYTNDCEEAWTANFWGADAMINSGVPEDKVFVFEHGVDGNIYTPRKRGRGGKVRFLHVDSGSPRKRSDLVLKAFQAAFGNNSDYELTLKYSWNSDYVSYVNNWSDKKMLESGGEWIKSNVRQIKEIVYPKDIVSLYHFHDVLVYPSEGEGFGLIPLEALATGMPVISTAEWCSYAKFFNENKIDATVGPGKTEWGYPYRGNIVNPKVDSIVDLMKYCAENIEKQSDKFFNQYEQVIFEYNWGKKTKDAFDGLMARLPEDIFDRIRSVTANGR